MDCGLFVSITASVTIFPELDAISLRAVDTGECLLFSVDALEGDLCFVFEESGDYEGLRPEKVSAPNEF